MSTSSEGRHEHQISLKTLITELEEVCREIRELPEDEKSDEVLEALDFFESTLHEVRERFHIERGARQYFLPFALKP